jgi:two-component system sensor histidine kinase DesK
MHHFAPARDSLLAQVHRPVYLRWQAGVQLVWLVALVQYPVQHDMPVAQWLLPTLASIAIYLALYLPVFIGPVRRLPWFALGMVLLGFALWRYNPVAIGYVINGCVLLSFGERRRVWVIGTTVAALLTLPLAHVIGFPLRMALFVFAGGLAGGFGNYLYMATARKDAELRLSQQDVRRLATLAERERIGRDLHDLLGHTLSLVALKSELARRLALADPPRAQREMEEVERVARHALTEVRAAVTGMRSSDLAAELISARLMLEASGVAFDASLPEGMQLPPAVEATLALVLREAVTNIHRHAHARSARILFHLEKERLLMQICDDGRGGLAAHGNGVAGMRERVRALGGALQIDSPARRGTAIAVSVPLAAAARAVA